MIRIVIIGVGNCASSLVQGAFFYANNHHEIGLIHKNIRGIHVDEISFVGAIDIDRRKIGKDLSEAIFSEPNCATIFQLVAPLDVKVVKGPVLDGVAKHMANKFIVDENDSPVNVSQYLREVKADFVICYLPVGSELAAKYYAQQALEAGVGFINAIPVFICSTDEWHNKFKSAGLICIGDDIKSQFGATYLNRVIVEALLARGFCINNLYQLNIGGNTDFLNMLDEGRLESKRTSKTNAVSSLFISQSKDIPPLRIGPSDYIPHLGDTKVCYINISGQQFGSVGFEIDIKLKVEDSPNSAGVMLDIIRMAEVARRNGLSGSIEEISAYGFKNPIKNIPETIILNLINKYI